MAHWFKPKHYGLGAYPSTWQGWALTASYIAAIALLGAWLSASAEAGHVHLTPFLILTGALTALFLVICWRTTEGGWRWRWGKDD